MAMNCKLGAHQDQLFWCLIALRNGRLNIVEKYDVYVIERLALFKYCRFVGNNFHCKISE